MKNKKLLVLGMATIATALSVMLTNSKNANNVLADDTFQKVETDISSDGIYEGSVDNVVDNDNSTYLWLSKFGTGNYVQLNYETETEFNNLTYLFDENDYCKFKVQYLSSNGWDDATGEIDSSSGTAKFNEKITTTSLRITCTASRGGVWVKIFELTPFSAPEISYGNFELVSTLTGMVDKNIDTYTYFDWNYTSESYVTLNYGKSITLTNIMLLTGCEKVPYDFAGNAKNGSSIKFSYSIDGDNFTDIEGTYTGKNIYVDLADKNITAQYIKFNPVHDGLSQAGLTIREFGANLSKFTPKLTFSGDDNFTYDGNPHSPTISASYGVDYTVVYNNEGLDIFGRTDGGTEAGWWAAVCHVVENNIYSDFPSPSHKVFTITAPDKVTPTIEIYVNGEKVDNNTGGATYKTDALPTFTNKVDDDAEVSYYYTTNDGETNLGTEMPNTPGTYAYNVAVAENDKYLSSKAFYWFNIVNADKVDPVITPDETEFYYDGNSHTPNLIPPEGVEFAEKHYEQNGTRLSSAPIEPGTYALVYTTIENDTYNAYSHWVVFTIIYDGNSFLTEWHKLRADGGNDGICAFINDANGRLSKLLDRYNNLTDEQRTWVDAQVDIDDVTIGQTLTYIASIRSWINDKVSTNVNTANNLISTINNETNSQTLIVIIAIACASLIGYFYIVEKKKKENN